jgi:hypothetical protein
VHTLLRPHGWPAPRRWMSTKMPFAFVGTPTATTQQLGRCLYTLNSIGLVLSKMELGDLVSLCRVSTRACARARIRTVKCCDCSFQHHCDDPLGEIGSDDTRGNGLLDYRETLRVERAHLGCNHNKMSFSLCSTSDRFTNNNVVS